MAAVLCGKRESGISSQLEMAANRPKILTFPPTLKRTSLLPEPLELGTPEPALEWFVATHPGCFLSLFTTIMNSVLVDPESPN